MVAGVHSTSALYLATDENSRAHATPARQVLARVDRRLVVGIGALRPSTVQARTVSSAQRWRYQADRHCYTEVDISADVLSSMFRLKCYRCYRGWS